MLKTIAVVNQKGGVGKTSTVINVSHAASMLIKERPIYAFDLEPSANTSKVFCMEKPSFTMADVLKDKSFDINEAVTQSYAAGEPINNHLTIASHISLANTDYLIHQRAHQEKLLSRQIEKIKLPGVFFMDLPPMLTNLSINGIYAANFIIIVMRYEKDAMDGIDDLFNTIKEVKENDYYDYKILLNGLDARKKTTIDIVDKAIEPFIEQGKVFNTVIRQREEINLSKFYDQTVFTYAPKSDSAKDYLDLTKEIITWVNQ